MTFLRLGVAHFFGVERIDRVELADDGRVFVFPAGAQFPFIYREALEVSWDDQLRCLVSPPSARRVHLASPEWWFRNILSAADAQGVALYLHAGTRFTNVSPEQRQRFESAVDVAPPS